MNIEVGSRLISAWGNTKWAGLVTCVHPDKDYFCVQEDRAKVKYSGCNGASRIFGVNTEPSSFVFESHARTEDWYITLYQLALKEGLL